MAVNALQAVLDRAAKEAPAPSPKKAAKTSPAKSTPASADVSETAKAKPYRPVRDGKRFIGGHFDPEVSRQLRIIAAEDDTTIQALLEEAVELLFVKKGKQKMASLASHETTRA